MRHQRGQATVDYLAVVLLVALVMAAAAGLLIATGLGGQVVTAMKRALCIVTGGPCDAGGEEARAPCVRSSEQYTGGVSVSLVAFRLGDRGILLREERSDGTVAITVVDESELGLDGGTGVGGFLRWGEHSYAVGAELRAAVLAGSADGRTWVARDGPEAERLMDTIKLARLSERTPGSIPPSEHYSPYPPMRLEVRAPDPDVTFRERTAALRVDFRAGTRRALELSVDHAYGERIDHRSGARTVYVRLGARAGGKVSFGEYGAEGETAREERVGITYDRDGRPVDFMVLGTLDVDGAVGLPPHLSRIAGWLRIPLEGAKHLETEQHLDLADPANAQAAQDFLTATAAGAGLRAAARLLRERLDEAGTLNVRTYAADSSAHEVGGHAKVGGVGVGGRLGSEEEASRLVSAVVRGEDGRWADDPHCRPA